ncbi:MAG: serine hydrolase domain-containing protein [Pseudomonadota bacterium]
MPTGNAVMARARLGLRIGALLLVAAISVYLLEAPRSEAAALDRVERLAGNTVRDGHWPSLSVAYVAPGEVLWTQSFGLADIDAERPMTPDTVMPIGSISKVIIGLTAAVEAAAGRFDVDASLEAYWPDVPGPAASLTFRQLATHTSGLRDTDTVYEEAGYAWGTLTHPVPLKAFLISALTPGGALYSEATFGAAPGETRQYSNIGAGLAAQALAEATGVPFEDLTRRNVLAPLGLERVVWDATLTRNRATLYGATDAGFEALEPYALATWPDGGLNASVSDLARLLAAIVGGGVLDGERIIPAEAVALQRLPAFPSLTPDGLFWAYEAIDLPGLSLAVEGHNGADPGLLTLMYRVDGTDRGFVLMVNGFRDTNWTLLQAARLLLNLKRAAERA